MFFPEIFRGISLIRYSNPRHLLFLHVLHHVLFGAGEVHAEREREGASINLSSIHPQLALLVTRDVDNFKRFAMLLEMVIKPAVSIGQCSNTGKGSS